MPSFRGSVGALIVLTVCETAIAQISAALRHTVAPSAGHEIHLFDPHAVVQAVQDVIEAARTGTRLPQR